jgi:hypothetical protein
MQTLTFEMIKGALAVDHSISPKERKLILNFLRSGNQQNSETPPSPPELLRRDEAAARLKVSLRTIDLWASQGILTKITLPGRQRACGFSSVEIDRLARGYHDA